jgi:hypothetical protein
LLLTGDATYPSLCDGLIVRLTSVNQHHLAKKAPVDRVRWRTSPDNAAGSACGSFATHMRWLGFPFQCTTVSRPPENRIVGKVQNLLRFRHLVVTQERLALNGPISCGTPPIKDSAPALDSIQIIRHDQLQHPAQLALAQKMSKR